MQNIKKAVIGCRPLREQSTSRIGKPKPKLSMKIFRKSTNVTSCIRSWEWIRVKVSTGEATLESKGRQL